MKNKKNIFSWVNKNVEVKKASGYGKGVFAKKDIKKNEVLAVFGGYILQIKEEEKLPKKISDYALQLDENFIIGITKISEIGDAEFFNHSCNPNAGFKGQLFLVSMRKIKKGEQITFDYAMTIQKGKNTKFYKLKCKCGFKNCRKYITENDWKKIDLQKKYNGYFQYSIQEKINKNNKNVLS